MAQKPDEDTTPPAYLERSAFACSAVYADEEVRGLEKPLRTCHVGLKTAVRSLEDLREVQQGKLGVLVQLDGGVDRLINDFVARLLGLVGKDYEHPTYRRYVPKSLRDITHADMRTEEPVIVADMIEMMDEDKSKPGIGPLALEYIPKLKAALDPVIIAEQDLTQTEKEGNHLDNKTIPALMVDWKIEYTKLEAALTLVWPLDAERVQRCFKPFRKPKKKAKKADEPAKPPAAGTAGGNGATAGSAATTAGGGAATTAGGGSSPLDDGSG